MADIEVEDVVESIVNSFDLEEFFEEKIGEKTLQSWSKIMEPSETDNEAEAVDWYFENQKTVDDFYETYRGMIGELEDGFNLDEVEPFVPEA